MPINNVDQANEHRSRSIFFPLCSPLDLEDRAAKLLGKESALFVLSGTMGNILAVMAHCQKRGAEIFVGSKSHLFLYEQANMAQVRTCVGKKKENSPSPTIVRKAKSCKANIDFVHSVTINC